MSDEYLGYATATVLFCQQLHHQHEHVYLSDVGFDVRGNVEEDAKWERKLIKSIQFGKQDLFITPEPCHLAFWGQK